MCPDIEATKISRLRRWELFEGMGDFALEIPRFDLVFSRIDQLRLDSFVVLADKVNQPFHGLNENSPAIYGWVVNGKPKQVPQGTAESFVPAGTRRFVGRRTQH